MSPSVDSLRLRALALELLPQVTKRGECVAITGSAARGNASSDSNLDLWILGARSGRFVKRFNGTSVTLLCQRPEDARAFDNLCLHEVDDLLLLDDREGEFEALRAVWRKQRRRVRAHVIRSTQKQIQLDLKRGATGSDWNRSTFLRLAAWRLLCLRVYIDHGWRVPRVQALRASLPKVLAKRLDDVLALPKVKAVRAAMKLMPKVVREAKHHGALKGYVLPSFDSASDEAGFVARRALISELLPCVFSPWGITDVRGVELLERVAPATVKVFSLLMPAPKKSEVRKLEVHVAAIQSSL